MIKCLGKPFYIDFLIQNYIHRLNNNCRPSQGSYDCPSSIVVISLLGDSSLIDFAQPRFIALHPGSTVVEIPKSDSSD